MDFSGARAVEFGKPDPLPCPQKQFPPGDDKGDGRPDKACLGMGRRIALAVEEFPPVRGDPVQGKADVMGDIGVGVFVYRNCRSGMGNKYHANSLAYAGSGHRLPHPA